MKSRTPIMNNDRSKKKTTNETDSPKKIEIIQIVLVVFTGIIALTSICQTCTVKKSMETSNKAYISFVKKPTVNPITTESWLKFINTGNTPASNIRGFIKIMFDKDHPRMPKFNEVETEQFVSVLGANNTLEVRRYQVTDNKQRNAILSGELAIFVLGTIHYLDIFEEKRCFVFCFKMMNSWDEVVYCEQHNNTNCEAAN